MSNPDQQRYTNPDLRILNPGQSAMEPVLPGRALVKPTTILAGGGVADTPTSFAAAGVSTTATNQVHLTWNVPGVEYGSGYEIQRKTGAGGTFATIACVRRGTVSYFDNVIEIGTYYYQIRGFSGSKVGSWVSAGPVDGGSSIGWSSNLAQVVEAPSSGSGFNGGLLVQTQQMDTYDDNTNGQKTVIKFKNSISAAQLVEGGHFRLNLDSGGDSSLGTLANGGLEFSGSLNSGGTMNAYLRVRYITADFDPSTLTWSNVVTSPAITIDNTHVDEFRIGYVTSPASGLVTVVSHFAQLAWLQAIASVGSTIYGMVIDGKLTAGPTVTGPALYVRTQTQFFLYWYPTLFE